MTIHRPIVTRGNGGASAPVAYLRGVAPSHVEYRPIGLGLQAATAVQRALECSQEELVAAQQQVAILTETIARLQRSAIEREPEFTKPWHFAPTGLACGTMLHEVPRGAAQCSPWKGADFCLFEGVDQDATAHVERLLTKRIRLRRRALPGGGRVQRAVCDKNGFVQDPDAREGRK